MLPQASTVSYYCFPDSDRLKRAKLYFRWFYHLCDCDDRFVNIGRFIMT